MTTAIYIVSGTLAILILVRVALPYIAVKIANRQLNKIEGIRGRIKSIGLNLLGGTFTIRHLEVAKRDELSGIETMIAKVDTLEIKIPVSKLIKKKFKGSVIIINPQLTYAVVLETPKEKKSTDGPALSVISPIRTTLEKFPFLALNVSIVNGKVRYINHLSKPKMDIALSALNIIVDDFSNQPAIDTATIQAGAQVYGGNLTLDMTIKPMGGQLTFELRLELKDADIVELNPYFRTFANIDVNAGTLGVFMEMKAEQGAFKGYLKPILKDVDVVGAEDSGDSIFKRLWEQGVAALLLLLKNTRTDQLATKIPFEGRLDDPHVNIGAAISGVLRNAFVKAIRPSFETAFNFGSVYKTTKGLISRFFNPDAK